MADEQRKPEAESQELLATPCRLAQLKKRSQIDFEIDFFERVLSRDPGYVDVLCNLGELFSIKGWHRRALAVDKRLAELRPGDALVLYNLACSHALLQQTREAMESLKAAVAAGYRDFEHLEQDSDLDGLREHPEFIQILKDALSLTR